MKQHAENLSRRERQIMDAVYRLKRATVSQIRDQMSDPPSYSATRTIVNVLEQKGHLRHRKKGKSYVYSPIVARSRARSSAMDRLLATFFDGSVEGVLTAFLEHRKADLTEEKVNRLKALIDDARKSGK